MEGGRAALQRALVPLLDDPGRSALLLDIDGTLAPIAPSAEQAAVPDATRELLEVLAGRYALVACVSGRRAADARRLVGVESITYIGNHGFERLRPGTSEAEVAPGLAEHGRTVEAFARSAYTDGMRELGVRIEDKGSIWSFHWRQAPDEVAARAALEPVAGEAERLELVPHWGRMVLEIRPPVAIDKGVAVSELVREASVAAALYAGDDSTDLHAFRELRVLERNGELHYVVCVGVRSNEEPETLAREADLLVEGTSGVFELLELLAAPTPDAIH